MTNFIFCLIFLQVSIFFVATGILVSWAIMACKARPSLAARQSPRLRIRRRIRQIPALAETD